MKKINLDHAEKIMYLTIVIKSICEENNLNKDLVIDDIIYILKEEIKEAQG